MFPVFLWILVFVSFFVTVQLVSFYLKRAESLETSEVVLIKEKEDSSSR